MFNKIIAKTQIKVLSHLEKNMNNRFPTCSPPLMYHRDEPDKGNDTDIEIGAPRHNVDAALFALSRVCRLVTKDSAPQLYSEAA